MAYKVRIVRTVEELQALDVASAGRLVADVETYGTDPENGKLLGIALAPLEGQFAGGVDACYVVVQEYLFHKSEWQYVWPYELRYNVGYLLGTKELVGHNYTYDKRWLDFEYNPHHPLPVITTKWHADTRIQWHMSDRPLHSKPYGLKDAQVEVLGWDAKGDEALNEQIRARGGRKGKEKAAIHLADTDTIGYYAGLDVISTAQLYKACKPHFDKHDQWDLLEKMMQYSWLLSQNTEAGVKVDVPRLERQRDHLKATLDRARAVMAEKVAPYVKQLEERWRDDRAAKYSTDKHRQAFLETPAKWKKFNPSSDSQKRELFYGIMGLPVTDHVKPRKDRKTGRKVYSDKAAVTLSALAKSVAGSGRSDLLPMIDLYETAEHAETMLRSFVVPWLASVRNGRIHPGYNVCGTVTYRLSGFKPQFLNLPFEEKDLMACFSVDEGMGGVHADLRAAEPTVTAHYSQDPGLLKVFRDGLGDVYLDLALTLFPKDTELRQFYDPNVPVTDAVKERFKRQRKVAKVVQLAVQYTGTGYTVSKSLGCSLEEAERLVDTYWKHFKQVERMNTALLNIHEKRGYLTNAVGRTLQVPQRRNKDVPNTFFQSSAHDMLSLWVLEIYRLCGERGIRVTPVILDTHDATSNSCPLEQVPMLEQAYSDALDIVNNQLGMSVPLKMDTKRFTTLAGLKSDEVYLTEETA